MAGNLQLCRSMYRACIVAADTQQCRIYLFDRTTGEDKIDEHFIEADEIASTHVEHRGAPDHARIADLARHVMARTSELTDEHAITNVVLVAGPRMLGQLRLARPGLVRPSVNVTEVAHELTKLSPHDLRVELSEQHALPPPLPRPAVSHHEAHRI